MDQIGPGSVQDWTKRAIKSFEDPESCICKHVKKPTVFLCFWGPRPPKTASETSRWLPRGTRRARKLEKKAPTMDPKNFYFWTNFGPILGPFWGQNWLQKGTKNETIFGTPRRRLSGVGKLRFCELNRRGGIAIATGIIFDKRKGGIKLYRAQSFV